MIVAICIGRKGSKGLPGKNTTEILGRPLCAYPFMATVHSDSVDRLYVSTDDPEIAAIAGKYGATIIERPPELAADAALGEDAYRHAADVIRKELKARGEKLELLVLLMCNAPMITAATIDEGVRVLKENPSLDSAVTVSEYNMFSPARARTEDTEGLLKPFIPFEAHFNRDKITCDRNCQGSVWFADMGVSIIRPECLESISTNLPPQRWMGRRIYPLKQWGGLDMDYEYQLPQTEFWLKAMGFSLESTPYDK